MEKDITGCWTGKLGILAVWRGMDVPEETLLHYLHLTLEGTFDQAFRRVQEEERGAAASNA